MRYEDSVRTERNRVKYTEAELEEDQKLLNRLMIKYPVVGNAIIKLRCEKADLQNRIDQLEREVVSLQHQGSPPFHDLGQ